MTENISKRLPAQQYYYLALVGFLIILWSVTLTWFHFELQMHFSHNSVALVIGLLLATVPAVAWLIPFVRIKRQKRQCQMVWFALLSWLLLLNNALLYYTGGTINPLIHLLLAPLVLGMLILSTQWFMLLAALAAASYLSLSQFYVPIMSLKVQSLPAFFAWHLHGSMLVFILLVMLLSLLIFPLRRRLDAQSNALAQQQNRALQNEYLLAVASIASASVHKLSTPLNSLALLQDLLKNEVKSEQGLSYLDTANKQVLVCIDALQELRNKAEEVSKTADTGVMLKQFLKDLRQEFALLHPQSELQISPIPEQQLKQKLFVDAAFKLAVMNLLDNAARYSPKFVRLQVTWQAHFWQLKIEDQGGGLADEELAYLGKGMVEEHHGIGMGVFLSRMIIERFNGHLSFENQQVEKQPGLVAMILLPSQNQTEIKRN